LFIVDAKLMELQPPLHSWWSSPLPT